MLIPGILKYTLSMFLFCFVLLFLNRNTAYHCKPVGRNCCYGQRAAKGKRAQIWIFLLNPINANRYIFKFLVRIGPPSFSSGESCSGLVLNLIRRKDRVCLTGLLMLCARYPFSVSFELSALGSSNTSKTRHIVCSNLWTRKSGFTWFSFFLSLFYEGKPVEVPIFLLLLLHFYLCLSPCLSGLGVLPQGDIS